MFALIFIGACLLALVLFDIAVTTLTMRGAGPLTSWSLRAMWSLLLALSRGNHRVLAAGGTAILVASILTWVLVLWASWSLIFLGGNGAVVNDDTGLAANFWDTVYFAGFTLFTLGLGDFRPEGAVWQILTGICVANGLLALTMSVTYLMPVLSAAAGQRQLAAQIHGIGSTPGGILRLCWNGSNFCRLEEPLNSLNGSIVLQAQQHLAYPALNYLHSDDPKTSLPLRVAALDEALGVLVQALPSEAAPERLSMIRARSAIKLLLEALDVAHITPAAEAPPAPSSERLKGEHLSALDHDRLRSGIEANSDRRQLLLAWVQNDGRRWDEIWEG